MDLTYKYYNPFRDKVDALLYYSQKINDNFDFLNHQNQTHFHEVDIKRYEARQCVVLGLGISAIVMVSVTLEECLKTLLKYHHFTRSIDKSTKPSLEEWEKTSLEAEDSFGTYRLHNAIQKARKEELITPEEEHDLMNIKEFIRNAFIHSDKSKIFDAEKKTPVSLVAVEDDSLKIKERRDMNLLGLNIAQGIAEKKFADENCFNIFQDVDRIIVTICERFWSSRKKEENTPSE
jgi:hypothetical protein